MNPSPQPLETILEKMKLVVKDLFQIKNDSRKLQEKAQQLSDQEKIEEIKKELK